MSTAKNTKSIIGLFEDRLTALRSQLSRWFWVDGLMRLGWAAIALIALDLLIDWFFRFDFSQRFILLVIMIGVLIYVARKWLYDPLTTAINDDALCLQVESQNPHLKQSLISTLQFSRLEGLESRGMSLEMVKQTISHGLESAEQIDFRHVLDLRGWRRNVVLLITALLLLLGTAGAIFAKTPMQLWFQRNVLLNDAQWPQKTYLRLEGATDGKIVFPRGGEWNQVVTVAPESQLVPASVFLEFRRARGRAPLPMKKTGEARFETLFANVLEPFEFRARGGDDITSWVRVQLVEPPGLDQLTLSVTSPKYAGGETETLPAGQGPYFLLPGSRLELQGLSNKPLNEASLLIDGMSRDLKVDTPKGGTHSSVLGVVADAPAGQYTIDLEDTTGLHPLQPLTFGIRSRQDREPRVKSKLVGIGTLGMISPKARLPVELRVSDDFGLTQIRTDYQTKGEGEDSLRTGTLEFDSLNNQTLEKETGVTDVLEIAPLAMAAGDTLVLTFVGVDNDDVLGPNIGKSSDYQLRIVTEEELRNELLRREKEQRQEFERLVKNQEELLTDTKALGAETHSLAELSPEQRGQLMQIQRRQKLIATGSASVAERLETVVLEALNNRIENEGEAFERRLRGDVIGPLFVIANDDVTSVIRHLDEARKFTNQQASRQPSFASAVQAQEQVLEKMRGVLGHLLKAEGFQEAINLILEIQRSQQDVLEKTLKEKQERLKKLLEEQQSENK